MALLYLDASAGVKLVMHEAESVALHRYVDAQDAWTSSALFRPEVLRAARRGDEARLEAARELLRGIVLVAIDEGVLLAASELDPPSVRTLDAIHLATALRLADELEAIVTYDRRMIEGARALGLPVASPA